MDHSGLLLSQYCDGDLSEDDRSDLADWMKQDPAHVDRFVRACYLHSLIGDLLREQTLQSDAWSHALRDRDPYPSSARKSRPRSLAKMMTAGAILAGTVASIFILFSLSRQDLVAQVTSLQGTTFTSSRQKVLAGAFLPKGETLRIDDGELMLTFECGAKVLIEGPAEFVVESDSVGALTRGLMSARVPTQAIGFAIRTPLLEIIDLGTEFQTKILNDQRVELHVFDGLVEVRLNNRFEHANDAPLRISEGRSILFDLGANEIVTVEYDESMKRDF